MADPMLSVRVTKEELALIDAKAEALGVSRSDLIRRLAYDAAAGDENAKAFMEQAQLPAPRRRRNVRIARWCSVCHSRKFGDPKWECPEHPGKTELQPNRPYFGQSTEATEEEIAAVMRGDLSDTQIRALASTKSGRMIFGSGKISDEEKRELGKRLKRASDLL